jgi:hypothetical protein
MKAQRAFTFVFFQSRFEKILLKTVNADPFFPTTNPLTSPVQACPMGCGVGEKIYGSIPHSDIIGGAVYRYCGSG